MLQLLSSFSTYTVQDTSQAVNTSKKKKKKEAAFSA